MARRALVHATLSVFVLGLIWAFPSHAVAARLRVASTIFPLYDLVRQVAGHEVEVTMLVPPGASPHTVAFKPSMVRTLAGSAVVFTIGHGLDDWAVRLAAEAGGAAVVTVDAGITLRPWGASGSHADHAHAGPHGAVDPHYWLTVPHAMHMVQTIAATLGRLDPPGQRGYAQRATAYREQLQRLEHEIRQLFAGVARRDVAFFHPAFGYFTAHYGLRIVAVFEPAPGREPGPGQVKRFLQQVQAHGLRVVFTEPQLDAAPLRSLARDLGVMLQELDPLGGSPGRASYVALMRFNASRMAASLRE